MLWISDIKFMRLVKWVEELDDAGTNLTIRLNTKLAEQEKEIQKLKAIVAELVDYTYRDPKND